MDDEEFNALVERLTAGLPATLVVTRLLLTLRMVVEDCGPTAAQALRGYCDDWGMEEEG